MHAYPSPAHMHVYPSPAHTCMCTPLLHTHTCVPLSCTHMHVTSLLFGCPVFIIEWIISDVGEWLVSRITSLLGRLQTKMFLSQLHWPDRIGFFTQWSTWNCWCYKQIKLKGYTFCFTSSSFFDGKYIFFTFTSAISCFQVRFLRIHLQRQ